MQRDLASAQMRGFLVAHRRGIETGQIIHNVRRMPSLAWLLPNGWQSHDRGDVVLRGSKNAGRNNWRAGVCVRVTGWREQGEAKIADGIHAGDSLCLLHSSVQSQSPE